MFFVKIGSTGVQHFFFLFNNQDVGVNLVKVAEILGHADIKMTMRYAHPTPENKRRMVNVLASILCQEDRVKDDVESLNDQYQD